MSARLVCRHAQTVDGSRRKIMRHVTVITTAIALSIAAAGPSAISAAEQQLNPKAISIKLPDQIAWKRNAAGTNETALLYGDPDKPGPYVLMFKWLPGNMSRPHRHPNDRMITVLKGTWWVGTGEKYDPASTVPLPAGTYVTHFAKEIHYDGAKDTETWLLMAGEGPATSTSASTPPPAH
jgi:quercetin dioxygenase-like cupin family protein